jgi:serine/threonine protein kinase
MVDETEGSGEYNSGEDDHDGTGADLDEEQLERGRENLADLLRELDDEESSDGAPSFDRTDRLLRHQRNQLPMAYLRHMTHDFSKSCVQNTGVFGTLYLARDAEQDDEEHEPTFVLRKLDLGPAGPLKAVRDSVLDELVGECRQLRLSGFIPALAVTVAPTSVYLLYNVTDMLALRQLLSEPSHRRDLTLRMRVEILHKVALALHCLHTGGGNVGSFPGKRVSKPSFHGDVQPSNIYISVAHDGSGLRCDRVRMTDALVSRVVATDRRRFRHGDAVFGSRSYRCPRYERGSSSYDASSDMFSFGVVMAETLSGQLQRSPVKPSNDWQGGSTLFYDVYYDVVLAKEPFAFDPMRQEAKTALGESAVPAPPPTSPRAMQMLVQVMVSCLGPSPTKRPTAATVTRILEHEYLVAYRK